MLPPLTPRNGLLAIILMGVLAGAVVWAKEQGLLKSFSGPPPWFVADWHNADGTATPQLKLNEKQGEAVFAYADGWKIKQPFMIHAMSPDQVAFVLKPIDNANPTTDSAAPFERYLLQHDGEGRATLYKLQETVEPYRFSGPSVLGGPTLLPTDPEHHHTVVATLRRAP